jgi:hypothetical protein
MSCSSRRSNQPPDFFFRKLPDGLLSSLCFQTVWKHGSGGLRRNGGFFLTEQSTMSSGAGFLKHETSGTNGFFSHNDQHSDTCFYVGSGGATDLADRFS